MGARHVQKEKEAFPEPHVQVVGNQQRLVPAVHGPDARPKLEVEAPQEFRLDGDWKDQFPSSLNPRGDARCYRCSAASGRAGLASP